LAWTLLVAGVCDPARPGDIDHVLATPSRYAAPEMHDPLVIAGRELRSRLITGTGKYSSPEAMREAVVSSGCELVTVAVGRIDLDSVEEAITDYLPDGVTLLPNTAGSATAEEAVRIARLARAGGLPDWIKLEVIPDPRWLLPDPVETLKAAEQLVGEGFTVLPYVLPDPVLQRKLEAVGCAAVMPLAAPIGSGHGLKLRHTIEIMVEQAEVPVVVDAGLGAPSQAAESLELGADAVLVNTAIAGADDPAAMARAFRLAVEAGRTARLAGLIAERETAEPSSPLGGLAARP
jgi:thiazole synthase